MSKENPEVKLTILLVDESAEDREHLRTLLSTFGEVHATSDVGEGRKVADSLEKIDAVVAGIPDSDGESVFDLRDHLSDRLDNLPVAFCSHDDMSAWYDRVQSGEMLFYKPVDDEVLRQWLAETTGVDSARPMPTASTDYTEAISPGLATGSAPESLPDDLLEVGTVLGDYKLLRLIQNDENFAMYEAEQKSIDRKVALKILFRKHRRDPNWVGGFAEEARARALVTHPDISLVYEADQERGVTFYTLELIEGQSLAGLAAQKGLLEDAILWKILKSCGSAIRYLDANQMTYRPLAAETIFLINDDHPRIANPVKAGKADSAERDEAEQIRRIAAAVRPFLDRPVRNDPRLLGLIDRMSNNTRVDGIKTAQGLVDSIHRLENRELVYETPKATEKRDDRKATVIGIVIGVLIIAAVAIWYFASGANRPVARDFNRMVRIPEGPFIWQKDQKVELPVFWIDEYEVTIAQYADFLAELAANPGKAAGLRHPKQPDTKKSYVLPDWDAYYDAAVRGARFRGAPTDLNCPVTGVDWWDAHAYAKWRGNRLPTEQEWAKAGRGRSGNAFPWGNEIDLEKFNSGSDGEGSADAGSKDGYAYWAPVDAHPEDESRYGVRGLAGNVSEWTATEDTDPDNADDTVPIKRGASFHTTEGYELSARRPAESAGKGDFWTGFRTARDTPPPNEEPAPEGAPAEDGGGSSPDTDAGDNTPAPGDSSEPPSSESSPDDAPPPPAAPAPETPDSGNEGDSSSASEPAPPAP